MKMNTQRGDHEEGEDEEEKISMWPHGGLCIRLTNNFFRGYISDHLMIGNKFCHGQLASTFVLLMVVSWLSLSDPHLHLAIDLSQGPPICL